jgi:enoyl-CoA hydratase
MSESPVRLELGRVTRLVLNRPNKRNAMNPEMGQAVAVAVGRINDAPETRVVLLEGEGHAFCAGGDFSSIRVNATRSAAQNRIGMVHFYRSFLSVLKIRVPTIAVVHGAAVGAGLCIAMAADMRLAAREAKLAANFVRLGLHPGMGCTALLPRLVGPAKAAELILTGKFVLGDEAERIGLVNAAVPRGELEQLVTQVAEQVASAAPIAVAQAKATLSARLAADVDAALEREASAQAVDFTTADLLEGVSASLAGRAPAFEGR